MSTYAVPNIGQKSPMPTDSGFYADIRFDPNDSQPNYIGLNLTKGAATSSPTWKLYKFFYSGSNVTEIQLAYNTWDARASAF